MSGGIYAGGIYGIKGKVNLFIPNNTLGIYYYPSTKHIGYLTPRLKSLGSETSMYHCSPVILAFWSKEDESA